LNKHEIVKIVLLGTGTPNADPDRSGPSIAIVVNDTPYIVDLGPGVVRRAAAAHRAGVRELAVQNLKCAFLTHLHSDHTVGCPDFIFTPWVLGRDEPLEIYGPSGTRTMVKHILAAYQRDVQERLDGLEPANDIGHKVNVHEIQSGVVYRDSNVKVEAFPVRHGSWQAFGYKFETPSRTIVISGDTAPVETIVEQAQSVDVLIHEVYSATAFETIPPDWQRYHANVHTSSHELAAIASRAKPELLILYHQLFWGTQEHELLWEVQQRYAGKVVSGKDLEVY
jgi:ribonuclease BN (tRNA processing enzyme)